LKSKLFFFYTSLHTSILLVHEMLGCLRGGKVSPSNAGGGGAPSGGAAAALSLIHI
jgi:hypothetical protein